MQSGANNTVGLHHFFSFLLSFVETQAAGVVLVVFFTPRTGLGYLIKGSNIESDVLFFSAFGRPWMVLNSLEAAVDLLEKRGHKYSDRPRFVLWELLV